ncbi:AGE family epimerase/isomerase [Nocardioides marinquilinus]|uniref:AGE family epimerase/isomerase n=1 Tax=Nocardioides marinquilinus TaxID=1210400 RepID=A0ABP9Q2R4_9ACTN
MVLSDLRPDAAWLAAETDRLLDFGLGAAVEGGFGYLDDDGRPDPARPVELWITCRMTHVYSLGHLLGRSDAGTLALHGVASLLGPLHDDRHGGWLAPGAASKTAYDHAFVVLAASSAAAAGVPDADDLLDDAVDVLLHRFWDDVAGMVVEEWDPSWDVLDPYRGVNANMHAVEAMLAAADVLDRPDLRHNALRVTTRVVRDLAPDHHWRLPEHFDAAWNPRLDYNADKPADPFRPAGATVGHWLEWSRLSLQLRAALEAAGEEAPGWLLENAVDLFDAAVREGWAVDGADGFVYTVDFSGRPLVRQRMHWVLTEAVAAAAVLHAVTGEQRFADRHAEWWAYAERHLIDHERGSWHHELAPDNTPDARTWPGKPDLYHAVGATLTPRLPVTPTASVALRQAP